MIKATSSPGAKQEISRDEIRPHNVNEFNDEGKTRLHKAVESNDKELVEFL